MKPLTPEMFKEPPLSEEILKFREKWAKIELRIASMFSRVRPGAPWWYWFRRGEERFVLKVVMDGSGQLWTDEGHGGLSLFEWMVDEKIAVLCPVESWEPSNG